VNSSVSDDWGEKPFNLPNGAEAKTSRHLVPWPQTGISIYIYIERERDIDIEIDIDRERESHPEIDGKVHPYYII